MMERLYAFGERQGHSLVIAMMIFFAYSAIQGFWGEWFVDFSALYYAGHFFAEGDLIAIYAAPPEVIGDAMPPSWQAAVAADGLSDKQTYPFIYPPWVAAAMAPIATAFAPQDAMHGLLVVNIILLIASAYLGWEIAGKGRVAYWVWLLIAGAFLSWGYTAMSALDLGQAQILVFFLCLWAFERYAKGKAIAAGVLLAMAACIKVTPVLFGLVFLFDRNVRAFVAFTITGLSMVGLSVLLVGWDAHLTYLERIGVISERIYLVYFAWSLEPFLYEISSLLRGTAVWHGLDDFSVHKEGWIAIVSKVCLVATLVATWMITRDAQGQSRLTRQLLLLSIGIPLFMPLGWAHYFLFAVFLLPALLVELPRKLGIWLLVAHLAVINLFVQLVFIFFTFKFYPQIFLGVPLYLIFFGIICWHWSKETRSLQQSEIEESQGLHPAE